MKNNCSKRASVLSLTIALVVLTLAVWPTVGQGQRSRPQGPGQTETIDPNTPVPPNSWASFSIILERNIFSRTRRPAVRATGRDNTPAPPTPNPESYFVLKGVVQENDDFIAFVENAQTGTVQKLRRGDPVARGTIKTLTLDGLEYQMENKTVVVQLGQDLEGGQGAPASGQTPNLAATPTPTTTGSSPAATPAKSAPSGDEADILKRLMEQRKQQLGQ